MRIISPVFASIAAMGIIGTAHAAFIPSAGVLPGPATVIDFSDHLTQEITIGPEQVGALVGRDVLFTAINQYDVAGFSADIYGLGSNGQWGVTAAHDTFAWVNPSIDTRVSSMRFTFVDAPVSFVGGFMNYCVSNAPAQTGCSNTALLRALDINGAILEQYDLASLAPIFTPDELDGGGFRGISRDTADIYAFEFVGPGVLDDLTFSAAPVSTPTPGTLGLFVTALLFGGFYSRRLRRI
jgi:hypothetical protein